MQNNNTGTGSSIARGVVRLAAFFVILAAILILSSGRPGWVMAWVYVGANVSLTAVSTLILVAKDPGLAAERARPGKGAKTWDSRLTGLAFLLWPGMLLVAGLDERFGWSLPFAPAVPWIALGVWGLGSAFSAWAVASNRFYSRVIRIQADRGHTVATGGPYRYVRHPGYVGVMVYTLATPLMLGSLWAIIPAGLSALVLVVRTALEDRTLHQELDGYREYAHRTRYRLLPGVW